MATFEIVPFVGAEPLRFGMTPGDAHALLGEPRSSSLNRRGELDEDYPELSTGYSKADGTLVELGFVSLASVVFRGIDVFNDAQALSVLTRADGGPLEGLDFIVFPSLGIALADFFSEQESDRAITVFARGRWTDLKGFKPFVLKDDAR